MSANIKRSMGPGAAPSLCASVISPGWNQKRSKEPLPLSRRSWIRGPGRSRRGSCGWVSKKPTRSTSPGVASRLKHGDEIETLHLLISVSTEHCGHNQTRARTRYDTRQQTVSQQLRNNAHMQKPDLPPAAPFFQIQPLSISAVSLVSAEDFYPPRPMNWGWAIKKPK